MDAALAEGARQVPALAVGIIAVIYVVSQFLKFLREERQSREQIGKDCHLVQSRSIEALGRCESALERNSEAFERQDKTHEKLIAVLDTWGKKT